MPKDEKRAAVKPAPVSPPAPSGDTGTPVSGRAKPSPQQPAAGQNMNTQEIAALIDAASKRPSTGERPALSLKQTALSQSAEKKAAAEAARAEARQKRSRAVASRAPQKADLPAQAPAPYTPDGASTPGEAAPLAVSPSAVLAVMEAPAARAPHKDAPPSRQPAPAAAVAPNAPAAATVRHKAAVPAVEAVPPEPVCALEEEPADAPVLFRAGTPDSLGPDEPAKDVSPASQEFVGVTAILDEVSKKRQQKKPKNRAYTSLTAFGRMMARSGSVVVKNPFFRGVGNMLYLLGFYAECKIVQAGRLLRDTGIVLFHILKWLFGSIFHVLGAFFGAIWHDVSSPFVHMGRAVVNMFRFANKDKKAPGHHEGVTAREYLREGLKRHGHLLGNFAMFLLPLAALVVLVTVVQSVLGMKYALAVKVNEDTIGYVADQTVFEDAKAMLRSRLRLSDDQQMTDFQLNASLMLAKTDTVTTKDQIVNEALRSGAFDVVPATGLYIDNTLFAATTEGEKLDAFLDDLLETYRDPTMPDAEVRFKEDVVCEPNPDDIYLDSTVESYDTIVEKLTAVVQDAEYYTAVEGETMGDIAVRNNLQYEVLASRNPELESISPDDVVPAGTELLLHSAKPFLQVESSIRFESTEAIPFDYIEQEDPNQPIGVRSVTQRGEEGEQRVYEDYVYVDGELVSQTRVDDMTEVVTPAVDEVIVVGTAPPLSVAPSASGSYINPIPDAHVSSRGMSAGHRGRDYNAPEGTPIYAANGGTVIQATYHYSWGNMVLIQHPDGNQTLYAHMSYISVGVGQAVAQGQQVGAVGMTGNTTGPHLHLEVWGAGGGLVDPDSIIPYNGSYGW